MNLEKLYMKNKNNRKMSICFHKEIQRQLLVFGEVSRRSLYNKMYFNRSLHGGNYANFIPVYVIEKMQEME